MKCLAYETEYIAIVRQQKNLEPRENPSSSDAIARNSQIETVCFANKTPLRDWPRGGVVDV